MSTPPGASDGTRCVQGAECRSGFCVDGVCCQSACGGTCLACDRAGAEGHCLAVADGQDPGGDCADEPTSTCGRDGQCDGAGGCRRYAAGTQCGAGSCSGVTERAASTCDGKGACLAGADRSCAPAVCVEASCGTACTVHSDCQTGFFCDGTTCRIARAQGSLCEMDAQCSTGHCADGVCCGTACADKCYACNLMGSMGTCVPSADGADPRNDCPVEGLVTCGNSGGCDGRGACRKHIPGTPCGYGTCSGFTLMGVRSCDGKGVCQAGAKTDCTPYACNGPVCWTACATNDQCRPGHTCRVNHCQ